MGSDLVNESQLTVRVGADEFTGRVCARKLSTSESKAFSHRAHNAEIQCETPALCALRASVK